MDGYCYCYTTPYRADRVNVTCFAKDHFRRASADIIIRRARCHSRPRVLYRAPKFGDTTRTLSL